MKKEKEAQEEQERESKLYERGRKAMNEKGRGGRGR